ncbi:MAG: methyltransferase domain-containing protein [Alteromonadaceae bacterium]|nr:methyltransferase domain-containing protein [Alteromonadaceae bacterium]
MDSLNTKLTQIGPGIYKISKQSARPEKLEINGELHSRFMDIFYLRDSTQQLNESKVIALCREREKLPSYGEVNSTVKQVFSKFISEHGGINILEIGAGKAPTIKNYNGEGKYILADTDPKVVELNITNGGEYTWFSSSEGLKYPSEFFDLAFAVFVFHFKIYDSQLIELRRCIKPNGILLANVYLLNDEERHELSASIKSQGFSLVKVSDPIEICRNHEFWLFSPERQSLETAEETLKKILASLFSE